MFRKPVEKTGVSLKSDEKIEVSLKSDENNGYFT
jgi:hypothetical protein